MITYTGYCCQSTKSKEDLDIDKGTLNIISIRNNSFLKIMLQPFLKTQGPKNVRITRPMKLKIGPGAFTLQIAER